MLYSAEFEAAKRKSYLAAAQRGSLNERCLATLALLCDRKAAGRPQDRTLRKAHRSLIRLQLAVRQRDRAARRARPRRPKPVERRQGGRHTLILDSEWEGFWAALEVRLKLMAPRPPPRAGADPEHVWVGGRRAIALNTSRSMHGCPLLASFRY